MLKYKQGNLIEAFESSEINVMAHCTNTCCGMGAGIAKMIAKKYPVTSELDKNYRKNAIGTALLIGLNNGLIFNLYAQKNVYYSNFETVEMRLSWLKSALQDMRGELFYGDKIGVPLLLSGLAADKKLKGDMTDLKYFKQFIALIVEEELRDLDVTVYYL